MPQKDILFEANDKLRDGTTKRIYARPLILSAADMAVLWDKMKRFPILFATEKETDFEEFQKVLEDKDTILFSFEREDMDEPIGLGMITDIVPAVQAKIQVSFFDQRLKGREQFIREMVSWIFDELLVYRVAANLRADARSMRSFMERVGLVFEGMLKDWVRKGKRRYNLYLYGITRHEADEHWRVGRNWAKPTVRLLRQYEVR